MYRTAGANDGSPAGEWRSRPPADAVDPARSPEPALYNLLERLRSALLRPFDVHTVGRLRRRIAHNSGLERRTEAALASTRIFEQASLAARMGVWQCDLPGDRLTWSRGTYDLFGLQPGSQLARADILKSYSEASLADLERARAQAIAGGAGFGLDAEIRTPSGEKRWIRISATVERRNGEPVRLFGIKQDITEEKRRLARMSYLAEHDGMTGLANRARFQERLAELCAPEGPGGALLLIDLDGFKGINDTFGHSLGDECLVEIARRLSAMGQDADLIARIGGDEFAVLFGPSTPIQKIEAFAQRILRAAEMPIDCSSRVFQVSASIGYALTDGETSAAVFDRADLALYAAKAAGRGTFRGYSPALS